MELNELKAALDSYNDAAAQGIKALGDRMADLDARLNRPRAPGADHSDGAAEETKAFNGYLRKGIIAPELKSMSVGSEPDGGFAVSTPLATSITQRIFEISPIRQVARIVTITSDAFEEIADTDEPEATWIGETASRPETISPQIKKLRIPAHEIYSMPKATQALLEDASLDIAGWLQGKVAHRFARREATGFVNGTGIGQPRGFLTLSTATTSDASRAWHVLQYVPTGAAATFATATATVSPADCLIDVIGELKSAYRPNATWIMNRRTAATVRKFKDADGRFVWADPTQPGALPLLLGFPVRLAEDMPDIAAGAFPIAFGDFSSGYTVVDRVGISTLRDPYTAKPFVSFYMRKRVGGDVHNSEAIKLLKVAVS